MKRHSLFTIGKFVMILFMALSMNQVMAQTESVWVCDVKFKNNEFDNPHAGSGFLLKHENKVYGITAKHVLFFAKTENMNSISFGEDLKSWTLRSTKDSTSGIELGALINEDKNEEISMPPKGDWLIFEIDADLPKSATIHTLRETPLTEGEQVFFTGIPYGSKKSIKVEGNFSGFTQEGNLSLDVPNGNYGGCSGGPVTDKAGNLVGIVSMGYFNKELNKYIFEPASLDYFKEVISQ